MPKVVFVNEKKEIEVPQGANLRDEARKADVEVYTGLSRYLNCFGHGTCGSCHVLEQSANWVARQPASTREVVVFGFLQQHGKASEAENHLIARLLAEKASGSRG